MLLHKAKWKTSKRNNSFSKAIKGLVISNSFIISILLAAWISVAAGALHPPGSQLDHFDRNVFVWLWRRFGIYIALWSPISEVSTEQDRSQVNRDHVNSPHLSLDGFKCLLFRNEFIFLSFTFVSSIAPHLSTRLHSSSVLGCFRTSDCYREVSTQLTDRLKAE